MNNREKFNYVYTNGIWNDNNQSIPKSGPGSSIDDTKEIRLFLDQFCKQRKVNSLLDLGCGDLTWMPKTEIFGLLNYTGIDVVESLIKNHIVTYPGKTFLCLDVVNEDFPYSDIILIRDVLFHLKINEVNKLIQKIVENKLCRFLIVTSCHNTSNDDSFDAYFYHSINLMIEPFNMTNYIDKLDELKYNRSILVYEI